MAARAINKLFVGNLPWTIGSRELKAYFSEFGHVVSATVVFDRNSGMSRGYGFVLFSTQGGYDNATGRQNHTLEGNILSVQPAGN